MNEPASNGFVGFRIKLHQPVLPGTIVSNAADIYFDFNPPVHTNDAVVVAETSTSLNEGVASTGMRLFPNPAHEELVLSLDAPATIEVLDLSGRSVLRATGRGPLTHLAVGTRLLGNTFLRARQPLLAHDGHGSQKRTDGQRINSAPTPELMIAMIDMGSKKDYFASLFHLVRVAAHRLFAKEPASKKTIYPSCGFLRGR